MYTGQVLLYSNYMIKIMLARLTARPAARLSPAHRPIRLVQTQVLVPVEVRAAFLAL